MKGISEGGSYSRDPKTGELTLRTGPAAEVEIIVPADTELTVNVTPAAAAKPAKRSN
jgi:hypothetical protein